MPNLAERFVFKEVKEIKILGVVLGKDEKSKIDKIWEEVIGPMENKLNFY